MTEQTYKDWKIYPNLYNGVGAQTVAWIGCHKDYDPTPNEADGPPGDNRCIYGPSVDHVKDQIDDWDG